MVESLFAQIVKKETPVEAATYVVNQIISGLSAALTSQSRAALVLAGGSSFKLVYEQLAQQKPAVPWRQIDIFFGDERCVPPDDERSNYKMAYDAWLHIFADDNGPTVYRMPGELELQEGAKQYDQQIRHYGEQTVGEQQLPIFDVTLLGVGLDGHTASLFPQSLKAVEKNQFAVASVPAFQSPFIRRITLTPLTLNRSRRVYFLVTGDSKKEVVEKIVTDKSQHLPVSHIRPEPGEKVLVLDAAAAAGLPADTVVA